ncbi:MAG TPA: hypothetical protein VG815_17785 [Chloroflexota bacterium]|nr:hypothetical protein [Chloroflexota bacterium]
MLKSYQCGRCREEVAPGAMWCPHCGYDMSNGGSVETRKRISLNWRSAFEHAPRRFMFGSLAAGVVVALYLLLSMASGTRGNEFGILAFTMALFVFSADLSVRGLLQIGPTMISALIFLSVR